MSAEFFTRPGESARRKRPLRRRARSSSRSICGSTRTSPRAISRAVRRSCWRFRGRSCWTRKSSCSTSRLPACSPVMTTVLGDTIQRLRDTGITFAIIEHDMDVIAELCNPIYVLAEGRTLMSRARSGRSRRTTTSCTRTWGSRVSDAILQRAGAACGLRRRRHPERHRLRSASRQSRHHHRAQRLRQIDSRQDARRPAPRAAGRDGCSRVSVSMT